MSLPVQPRVTSTQSTPSFLEVFQERWRRLPLFWRFQLVGWFVFVIGNTLFKLLVLSDFKLALVSTLLQEPAGFMLTLCLHAYFRRLPPGMSSSLITLHVILACVIATLIDVSWFSFLRASFFHEHELVLPGNRGLSAIGMFRFMVYACWSFLFFWIRATLANFAAVSAANAAQLQALRAQLNPHFLFNALNSIVAEADDNPKAVKALAHELAGYLRYSLTHRHNDKVALGAELDALEHYLRVERMRFEDRLSFSFEVTPDARATLVPGCLLQPLVENAVKHGLHTSPGGLRILLRAACSNAGLRIEVGNSGSWRESEARGTDHGFGLESIRRRLELLYPKQHRVEIEHGQGWVNVVIEVPRA